MIVYLYCLIRYKILFVVIHVKSHSLKVDCDLLTVMLLHSHALTISVTIIHVQELYVSITSYIAIGTQTRIAAKQTLCYKIRIH